MHLLGAFMLGAWVSLGVVFSLAVGVPAFLFLFRPLRVASREAKFVKRRRDFHLQRERLEAKFIQLAAVNANANSPLWAECEFDDDVAYVRDRTSGELSAFVAVSIAADSFDLAESGLGELVGNLRSATAVFRFDRDHWETDGRAILKLSPSDASRFYQHDLEVIAHEPARCR